MKEKNINKDLIFIKKFSKLSVNKICKELNINLSNVLSNRAKTENILKVKTEIIKQVLMLLTESYE